MKKVFNGSVFFFMAVFLAPISIQAANTTSTFSGFRALPAKCDAYKGNPTLYQCCQKDQDGILTAGEQQTCLCKENPKACLKPLVGRPVSGGSAGGTPGGGTTGTGGAGAAGGPVANLNAWSRTFGSPSEENGESIRPTADGGYIIAGSFSPGKQDPWVIKLDSQGRVEWEKKYTTQDANLKLRAYSILQTSDSGYLLMGAVSPFAYSTPNSIFAMKLNADGSVGWAKFYSDGIKALGGNEAGDSILMLNDSFILMGASYGGDNSSYGSNMQPWLLAIGQDGSILWRKGIRGLGFGNHFDFIPLANNQGFLFSTTYSRPNATGGSNQYEIPGLLMRLNPDLTVNWQKSIFRPRYHLTSILPTRSGGFLLVANQESYAFGSWGWMARFNSDLTPAWSTYLSTILATRSIKETEDGRFFWNGRGSGGERLLSITANGELSWNRVLKNSSDYFEDLGLTPKSWTKNSEWFNPVLGLERDYDHDATETTIHQRVQEAGSGRGSQRPDHCRGGFS